LVATGRTTTLAACGATRAGGRIVSDKAPKKTQVTHIADIVAERTEHAEAGDIVSEDDAFWLAEGLSVYPLESGELVVGCAPTSRRRAAAPASCLSTPSTPSSPRAAASDTSSTGPSASPSTSPPSASSWPASGSTTGQQM